MLKLTKYEFRKNLPSIIIVFIILMATQAYFTVSCLMDSETHSAIAIVLLVFLSSVSFVVVIAFGISAYSKELNSNSSYLIFMTPNSSLTILLSKLLYTFLFGCMVAVTLLILSFIDIKMLTGIIGSPFDYIEFIKGFLEGMGIEYMDIVYGIITGIVSMIISIFCFIALSYFAITLASTMLQNKKGKGFVSTILFIAILIVTGLISDKLPVIYPYPETAIQAIITILPSVVFDLVVGALSIWVSAVLLDKKVSL